jgi:hypothetical protein
MSRAVGLVGLVVVGLCLCPIDAVSARVAPVSGTVKLGASAPDPDGGPPWVVRSWHPRQPADQDPDRSELCAQIGRLTAGKLVRRFSGGREIRLGLGDRTACGSVRFGSPPLLMERLVDDPSTANPRPVRTIVGGVAARGSRRVTLDVAGARSVLRIEPRSRTFLAVLPGTVRRADLMLRFELASGRQKTLDFARGEDSDLIQGSVQTQITVPDPLGGRDLALVGYAQRADTVMGERISRCTEPGRVVAGEVGAYEPRFGSFLDSPSLLDLSFLEGIWAPVAPPASTIGSCTVPFEPFSSEPISAVGAKRFGRRLVVVHGSLTPRVERIEARGARVRPSRPGVLRGRSFLVAVISSGGLYEQLQLVAHLRGGRKVKGRIALGPQDLPTGWTWSARKRGRVLRLDWIGGFEPFSGVEVREGRRIAVQVYQRFPPTFSAEGIQFASPDIGISKCVTFRLRRPLAGRPVVDGSTGRPRRHTRPGPLLPRAGSCRRVRPRPPGAVPKKLDGGGALSARQASQVSGRRFTP